MLLMGEPTADSPTPKARGEAAMNILVPNDARRMHAVEILVQNDALRMHAGSGRPVSRLPQKDPATDFEGGGPPQRVTDCTM